ncbi:CBS domain-containing protein [Candidatus Bathyarchaeota archaeon]|nr:CBS domain-containing protein [Candidatus Bathyarchaeota archaeon]
MSHVIPTGHTLREMRLSARLTQKALAERTGLSQALISRIERGSVDPRISTLRKIIDVLNSLVIHSTYARDIMRSPVISVNASQPLRVAVELMKRYDISQLPVMRAGSVVGSIQESTIIQKIAQVKEVSSLFQEPVDKFMEEPFPFISPETPVEDLVILLSKGIPALLVMERKKLVGIITKIDLITALLKKGEGFQLIKGGASS